MKNIFTLLFILLCSSTIVLAQYPGGVSASSTNELWLDALQKNVTDGAAIFRWNDFSGNANHADQSLTYRRPRYRANGINGMPAIDFDGNDDYLEIMSNSDFNSNQATHFAVFERSTLNNDVNTIFNMDFSEGSNLIFTATLPAHTRTVLKNSVGDLQRLYFSGGTNQVLSVLWDGTAGTLDGFLNGVAATTNNNSVNTATGHNLGRVGAFNTNYKYDGNIAEIIYYTTVLNSAERNIVENYLAAKYQIATAIDLYTHETTHRYDVVGIGQEADGNNLTASGTSNMDITAVGLANGEYVLTGHDNGGYTANTTDVPGGYNRYNQIWRSTLTGYSGTVDISFDVSTYSLGVDTQYILMVDADGVFATGATEYPGTYNSGTVTFTGVTLTSTSYFTLANGDFEIESTGVTNDWHLTTTWTCGCIPSLGSSVTILTGHDVFIDGQNGQVGDLIIDGSLTFNSTDTLNINGNLTNNNSIDAGTGTFLFTGASLAQNINGSAVSMNNVILDNPLGLTINSSLNVQGWLDVRNGSITTNNALTLLSNASGTAAFINPSAGEITGNYTIQRYLDEGESYYLLAPVVSGSTLEDWNQEFEMQGFTGTEWEGGVSSVYYFDQNNITTNYYQGYTVPSSTFDVIDPKVGYEIYVGDDTKATGARTIDITGTPVTGNISYSCPHVVKLGDPANDGWNLITNPYPAPVRWGTVTKSVNYDAAYRKKFDGSSVAIGNNYLLASGEAFWVHSNAGGSTIDFSSWMAGFNGDITDNYNTKISEESEYLEISLIYDYNATEESNTTYIGFDEQATNLKDNELDAFKLNNVFADKPNLSTENDGHKMEINVLSNNFNDEIPINILTEVPSGSLKNYSLEIKNVADLLQKNKKLVFEDRELGVFIDLVEDTSYSFTMMDSETESRFFLLVESPLDYIKTDVSCFAANDGKIVVEGYGSNSKNYIWKDEFDNIIGSSMSVTGADSLINLTPGTYKLEVTDNVSLVTVENTFIINEPGMIVSAFYSMSGDENGVEISSTQQADTLHIYTNQNVYFESNTSNNSIYSWNFGDLSSSTLENPTHVYFNAGIYKVELLAGNGVCEQVSEQYIKVDNSTGISETNLLEGVNVFTKNNELTIQFNNDLVGDYQIMIYNNVGQEVMKKNVIVTQNHTEKMELNVAQGVYMVTIRKDNFTKTEKIVISNK